LEKHNELFEELKNLATEKINPDTIDIDSKSVIEILKLINHEDKIIAHCVEKEIPYIARAVDILVQSFKKGGRLFYIGAGTSGRLGVLDSSEIPPTFGADPEMVQGLIAGGYKALVRAQEGAEDNKEQGAIDLLERGFTANDVACGIAASRRTPYVVGAIEKARELGAKTLYVTCTPRHAMNIEVDVAMCVEVGPEVIMGSTRMKSGTAEKLVLNMLTTTAMIRLGKIYRNMMVDLQMTSKKLEERSKRTVMEITGISYREAEEVLMKADGHVKTALVMIFKDVSADEARERLLKADGFVRNAIED